MRPRPSSATRSRRTRGAAASKPAAPGPLWKASSSAARPGRSTSSKPPRLTAVVRLEGARSPSARRAAPCRRSGADSSAPMETPHSETAPSERWKPGSAPAARPVVTDSNRWCSASQKRAVTPREPDGVRHHRADSGTSRPGSVCRVPERPSSTGSGVPGAARTARARDQAAASEPRARASSTASSRRATAPSVPAAAVSSREGRAISSRRAARASRSSSRALRAPAREIPAATTPSMAPAAAPRTSRPPSLRRALPCGQGQSRPRAAKIRTTACRHQAARATWEWRPETTMPRGPRPATMTTSGEPGQVTARRPGAPPISRPSTRVPAPIPARAAATRRAASTPRAFSTAAGSQARTSARRASVDSSAGVSPAASPSPSACGPPSGPACSSPADPARPPSGPAPAGRSAQAPRSHRQAATTWMHTPATGQGQRARAGPPGGSTTSTGASPTAATTASSPTRTGRTLPAATSARPRRTRPRLARAARATSSKAA